LRFEVRRVGLLNVRERGSIVLLGGSDLSERQSEACFCLLHRNLAIARIDLDEQLTPC
jgi:hypothetical protein